MKERPITCVILSNGESAIVDQDNYPKVQGYNWNKHPLGYAQGTKNGICVYMHALIMNTPKGFHTHHKNGNRLDNRRCNLEILTPKIHVTYRPSMEGSSNPFWGKTHSHTFKQNLSERCRKSVIQFCKDNSEVRKYKSTLEAEIETGISNGNISSVCLGHRKSAGGYLWKYVNDL